MHSQLVRNAIYISIAGAVYEKRNLTKSLVVFNCFILVVSGLYDFTIFPYTLGLCSHLI